MLPLRTRRRIAGGVAFLCTVCVFLFWLGFGPLGPTTSAETSTTPGPLATLREGINSLWGGVSSRATVLTKELRSMGAFIQEAASSTFPTSVPSQIISSVSTTTTLLTDTFITTSFGSSTQSN